MNQNPITFKPTKEIGCLQITLILLKLTQIAGFLPRRITSSDIVPEQIKAGEYLGMIKFGSRVDMLFPTNGGFALNVRQGQRVGIGDVIGRYL